MKIFLFDLGKTLLDNFHIDLENGISSAFVDPIDVDVMRELKQAYLSRTLTEIRVSDVLKELVKTYQPKRESIDELEYLVLLNSEIDHLLDNVEPLLALMAKKGYYLAVVSNSTFSGKALKRRLAELGIAKYFQFVLSSADTISRKPDAQIFQKALNLIPNKSSSDEIYYVGNDYELDIVGSSKVGMKPIWFNQLHLLDSLHLAYLNIDNYQSFIKMIQNNEL